MHIVHPFFLSPAHARDRRKEGPEQPPPDANVAAGFPAKAWPTLRKRCVDLAHFRAIFSAQPLRYACLDLLSDV
jgi:hypothetical protein